MRQGGTRQLFNYWNRIRAGRTAPAREEIEPSDIRHLLSDTFILDVSRNYRSISYRLAGTRLCAAHGRELKGVGFLVPFAEEACFDLLKYLSRVYDGMTPQVLSLAARTADDREIEYEMVLLPLKPVADGSCRVLGLCEPSQTPYWLGTTPLVQWEINAGRPVSPEKAALAVAEAPAMAPETGQMELTHGGSAGGIARRVVRHLVVHEGGRED